MQEKTGYALFDLDHTILPFDTQVFFVNFVLRQEGWRRCFLLWFLAAVPLALCRLLDLRQMKRLFFSSLWRMPEERLRRYVDEFIRSDFSTALYPEVVAEIQRHHNEGRITILNSASPEFYLDRIAAKLGFDYYLGTNITVENPMPFLPQIPGANNKCEAKITAMQKRHLLPEKFDPSQGDVIPDSWAYSDSSADIPLLSIAENGVMIHPDKLLAATGADHGWSTWKPRRPYRGKWGSLFATLLQICGLYQLRNSKN